MLKRGLILLVSLLSLLFLQASLAQTTQQDSCLAAHPTNILVVAERILQTYSQIYDDEEKAVEAALDSLNKWNPENVDPNWVNFKSQIGNEMRRIAGGSESCIDDYSLNSKDDCWKQDALCTQSKCVKFENMGWSEDVLVKVSKLKDIQFDWEQYRYSHSIHGLINELTLASQYYPKIIFVLIKILESPEYHESIREEIASNLFLSPSYRITVPVLIRILEDSASDLTKIRIKMGIFNSLIRINSEETIQALINYLINSRDDVELKSDAAEQLLMRYRLGLNGDNPTQNLFTQEVIEIILSNAVSSSPADTRYLLLETSPLFNQIYDHQLLADYNEYKKNSVVIATYRYITHNYGENPTNYQISSSINHILSKREKFKDQIIIGSETYFITFSHRDPKMSNDLLIGFAENRGVLERNMPQGTLEFKGPEFKEKIEQAIINSKNKGKTTIWINVHGLPNYVCLGGGIPNQRAFTDEMSCFGFRYNEFAEILLQRGKLDEVTLIIDSCFSYNFAEQLIQNLKEKGSIKYPIIITETNKDRLGYIGVFITSLNRLNIPEREPLLGRHIYEAEEYSFFRQDSAVFFSEDGISPSLEIAMNTLNPSQCATCTGDSCPIEQIQGEAS